MRVFSMLIPLLAAMVAPVVSFRQPAAGSLGFARPPMTLGSLSRARPLHRGSGRGAPVGGLRMQFIAEDGRTAEEYIKDIFIKYDTRKKGYLTQDEYNQWCIDTRRGGRVFENDYRWRKFVERTKGDMTVLGVTYQGLVDLYNSKEQSMGAAFPVIANAVALLSCLIVCIGLSIPYYLPGCTHGDLCRTITLPFS